MKTSWLYRIAGVLMILFALGHQLVFRQVDPAWNASGVVTAMQGTHFVVQGFDTSYWEFFSGFGFIQTIFLLFSAVLAFELGRYQNNIRAELARVRWAFALCFVCVAVITWTNFFVIPVVFATLIALCLVLAAMKREDRASSADR